MSKKPRRKPEVTVTSKADKPTSERLAAASPEVPATKSPETAPRQARPAVLCDPEAWRNPTKPDTQKRRQKLSQEFQGIVSDMADSLRKAAFRKTMLERTMAWAREERGRFPDAPVTSVPGETNLPPYESPGMTLQWTESAPWAICAALFDAYWSVGSDHLWPDKSDDELHLEEETEDQVWQQRLCKYEELLAEKMPFILLKAHLQDERFCHVEVDLNKPLSALSDGDAALVLNGRHCPWSGAVRLAVKEAWSNVRESVALEDDGPAADEITLAQAALECGGPGKPGWTKAAQNGVFPMRRIGRNVFVKRADAKTFAANFDARREQRTVGTLSTKENGQTVVAALKKLLKKGRQ